MALSSSPSLLNLTPCPIATHSPKFLHFHSPSTSRFPLKPTFYDSNTNHFISRPSSGSEKWRARVSFFPAFLNKGKDAKPIKEELLDAIAPLDRGADATPQDQQTIDQVRSALRNWEFVSSITWLFALLWKEQESDSGTFCWLSSCCVVHLEFPVSIDHIHMCHSSISIYLPACLFDCVSMSIYLSICVNMVLRFLLVWEEEKKFINYQHGDWHTIVK